MKRNGLLCAQRTVLESELNTVAKLVMIAILDHWSLESPQPFPTVATLAMKASCDVRSVQRAIRTCKAVGWLRVVPNAGEHRQNRYDVSGILPHPTPAESHHHPGTVSPSARRDPGGGSRRPRQEVAIPPGRVPPEGIQREGTHQGTQGERARKPRLVPDSDSGRERATALLEAFERIVHGGKRVGDRDRCAVLLGELLPALDDREPGDPVGLFERVLTSYTADRRSRSKTPTVELFVRDFAQWAEREIELASAPANRAERFRAERIRQLKAELLEATSRMRAAHKQGNDGERAAASSTISRIEAELVSLGVLPTQHDAEAAQ